MAECCVILSSRLPGEKDDASVWAPVAAGFKLDQATFEDRVLAAMPLIVRKNLDEVAAKDMVKQLRAIGVDASCHHQDSKLAYIERTGTARGPIPYSALRSFINSGERYRLDDSQDWLLWEEDLALDLSLMGGTSPSAQDDSRSQPSNKDGFEKFDDLSPASFSNKRKQNNSRRSRKGWAMIGTLAFLAIGGLFAWNYLSVGDALKDSNEQAPTAGITGGAATESPQHETVGSPSFDCKKARTSTESAICSNDALSLLDAEQATLYVQAMHTLDSKEAQELKTSQRLWLRARAHDCGSNRSCIEQKYRERIAVLMKGYGAEDSSSSQQASADTTQAVSNDDSNSSESVPQTSPVDVQVRSVPMSMGVETNGNTVVGPGPTVWHDEVSITSKIDDIVIQKIVINRGNCSMPRYGAVKLPLSLAFGEGKEFSFFSCNVSEVAVLTNRGTWTVSFTSGPARPSNVYDALRQRLGANQCALDPSRC